jgi:hypothetical protein
MRGPRARVAADGAVQALEQVRRHRLHRPGRRSGIEPAPFQGLARRHDAFRRNHRARPQHRPVHDRRMLADDAVVADGAGMHETVASDRHVRAHHGGVQAVGDVHGARFAEPAVGADAHVFAVGTHERQLAQAAAGTELGPPDYGGRNMTSDLGSDAGRMREVGQDDHRAARKRGSRGRCPTGSSDARRSRPWKRRRAQARWLPA